VMGYLFFFRDRVLWTICLRLAANLDPPNLWSHRRPALSCFFIAFFLSPSFLDCLLFVFAAFPTWHDLWLFEWIQVSKHWCNDFNLQWWQLMFVDCLLGAKNCCNVLLSHFF
jgi:hypothetical protein